MLTLLQKRRSIRQYQNRPVEPEKVDRLIETLLRSPSSRNLTPWEFIIVNEQELLKKLSDCKPHGAAFLKDAPLGIVIAADPERSDVWIEDCSIASILVQMAAEALGLSSCWIQVRLRIQADDECAEDFVKKLLTLPDSFRVLSIVAIGYPAEIKRGHPISALKNFKIHHNRFTIRRTNTESRTTKSEL